MVLTKQELLKREAITGFLSREQFQPAGIDLTLRDVFSFSSTGSIDFDNSGRKLSETSKLQFGSDGWLYLPKGAYKIQYNEIVKIPLDCIALAFPRSSLLRCGAFVHCAVWDPGYEGRSESLLVVENEHGIKLKKNARLVQLLFFKTHGEVGEGYVGKYQKENI